MEHEVQTTSGFLESSRRENLTFVLQVEQGNSRKCPFCMGTPFYLKNLECIRFLKKGEHDK